MLVVTRVVADFANSHRVGSDYPFLAEILPASDLVDKLGAKFAFQPGYHLFRTYLLSVAVEPRHLLVLAIEIALPLLEGCVVDSSFLRAVHLCFTLPFHGESKENLNGR